MPFKKGETPEGAILFKKGESGNPEGKTPGTISFKTIANKILDGEITVEQAGEMRKMTRREKMIFGIVNDAVNDEDPATRLKAVAYLVERTEGKVADKVDVTTNGESMQPQQTTILEIKYRGENGPIELTSSKQPKETPKAE